MNTDQQYPTVLKAKHVAEILGVSEPTAYTYMRRTDFPTINLPGAVKRVARDRFFEWLEGRGNDVEAKENQNQIQRRNEKWQK